MAFRDRGEAARRLADELIPYRAAAECRRSDRRLRRGNGHGVSRDAPALDIAYKLVEYAGKPRLKLSTGKSLLPGRKQIFRVERDGVADRDVLGRRDDEPFGRALLQQVTRPAP